MLLNNLEVTNNFC